MAFVRLFRELLSIPGHIDDGVAWAEILRRVGCAMTTLDIVLLIVGVPFLMYALTPEKFWVWIKGSKTDRDSQESRQKEPWEIGGARQPCFKLYEAACLLQGIQPAWPLTNQLAIDELDDLVNAVIVHDDKVEYVELRVVIPDESIRPLDPSDIVGQQHYYILSLRLGGKPTDSRFNRETDRKSLRNVKVDRKALREYLESKSRDIPDFLDERFDPETVEER